MSEQDQEPQPGRDVVVQAGLASATAGVPEAEPDEDEPDEDEGRD